MEAGGGGFTRPGASPLSSRLIDSFFPRVTAAMGVLEIGDGQVQVTLRGRKRPVPEDLLDVPQVGPVFKQVRGAGMPPDVAGDVLFDLGRAGVLDDQFTQDIFIQRLAASGEEEPVGCPPKEEFGTDGIEVGLQKAAGYPAQRHHAVVPAFALLDAQQFFFQIDVLDTQREQLRFADAGGIKDFQHRAVAVTTGGAGIDTFKDAPGFLRCEHIAWQGTRLPRLGDGFRRIDAQAAAGFQEREQLAYPGQDTVLIGHTSRFSLWRWLMIKPALEGDEPVARDRFDFLHRRLKL